MELKPQVTIEARITVSDREAEVLHLLSSQDLAEWFAHKTKDRITAPEVADALARVRALTGVIIAARDEAVKAINQRAREETR